MTFNTPIKLNNEGIETFALLGLAETHLSIYKQQGNHLFISVGTGRFKSDIEEIESWTLPGQ